MKTLPLSLIFFLLSINSLCGQNEKPTLPLPPLDTTHHTVFSDIDYEKIYLDAGGGYFPESGNNSWAGQLSAGYRFNPKAALGLGVAYFGRASLYERRALGLGVQYRQTIWRALNAKIEVGYVLNSMMYDHKLDKKMDYLAASSSPIYYKFDLNWRIKHYLTLGISVAQTNNLSFRRYVSDAVSIVDVWRVNALTIQLGVALDTPD
jgi:hypothetical protein